EPAGIERAHAAMAASAKSRGDAIRDVAQAKAGASIGLLAGGARFSVILDRQKKETVPGARADTDRDGAT
uniref:hypothetical protein n=1 Tax=Acinetobacter baumannii TaxID=470 RepID=UPI001C086F16